jgi:hypothetical protein
MFRFSCLCGVLPSQNSHRRMPVNTSSSDWLRTLLRQKKGSVLIKGVENIACHQVPTPVSTHAGWDDIHKLSFAALEPGYRTSISDLRTNLIEQLQDKAASMAIDGKNFVTNLQIMVDVANAGKAIVISNFVPQVLGNIARMAKDECVKFYTLNSVHLVKMNPPLCDDVYQQALANIEQETKLYYDKIVFGATDNTNVISFKSDMLTAWTIFKKTNIDEVRKNTILTLTKGAMDTVLKPHTDKAKDLRAQFEGGVPETLVALKSELSAMRKSVMDDWKVRAGCYICGPKVLDRDCPQRLELKNIQENKLPMKISEAENDLITHFQV